MKKIYLIILIIFFNILLVNAETITVPKGTLVSVELQRDISSRKLKADDLVPILVIRDTIINNKIIFAKGSEGYLRVFDCAKVDTWGSNWRNGAIIEFDGAELKDITGQMRKFNYNERLKGADITVGTAISSFSNSRTSGNVNSFVNASSKTVNPYGQTYTTTGSAFGTAKYSENTNNTSSAFLNGHRFIGENILIKKGRRFRIDSMETFKIDIK